MRILFIANDFPNPWIPSKGPFNLALAKALREQNDVRIVSPVSWFDELSARRAKKGPIDRDVVRDGIPTRFPRYIYPPGLARGLYTACYARSIRSSVNALTQGWKPDAVLSYWAHPDGEAASRVARRLGVPSLVIVGGSDVLVITRDAARRKCVQRALQSAGAVVCVSRHLREKVIELGIPAARVHTWSQGVDQSIFHTGSMADARGALSLLPTARVILWVGRMVAVKGLDVLIGACAHMRARNEPFQLCLVGDGPLKLELRDRAKAAGVADQITWIGHCAAARLGDWYRAADVTVLPSRSEGLPNVLRESHACGTPFVASNVGGISELAGGSDFLVEPENPVALADALIASLRAGQRSDASATISSPSWSQSAARLVEIISALRFPQSAPSPTLPMEVTR